MKLELHLKDINGNKFDITQLVESYKWSGNDKEACRKLEFTLITSYTDKNIPRVNIDAGNMVIFFVDGEELFRGYVDSISRNNGQQNTSYIAYDSMERINNVKVYYKVPNDTASNTYKKLLKEYGLLCGATSDTTVKHSKIFMNVPIYNIVMTLYTEVSKSTGKTYMLYSKEGKFFSIEKGIVKLKVAFEDGKNISESEYTKSRSGMVNKVIIIDENGKKKKEFKNDDDIKNYGLYQEILQEAKDNDVTKDAKSMLKGTEETCSLKGFGDITCITGYGVQVKDSYTGLVGLFYIIDDIHTWNSGVYNIELKLSFKNLMTEYSDGQDEEVKK